MCQQQPLKTCTGCRVAKSRDEFTKATRSKDGLNGRCKVCTRAAGRVYQAANKEKTAERGRRWYAENKDRHRAKTAKWFSENPGKASEYCAAWRARNPEAQAAAERSWYERNREKSLRADKARREANLELFLKRERESYARNRAARSARGKRWREANKHRVAYHAALRRKATADRTPSWLTEEDFAAIDRFFYKAARMSQIVGVPYHVDHVVPLRGKLVSGLNVPWNLQVLPATENLKKSNLHAVT